MKDLIGDLDTAIHATVHDYVDPLTGQRGAVALAPRLGMQPGTLSNKANPLCEDHQLSLRQSVPLQLQALDFRILHSYAHTLGHVCYRIPSERAGGDIELLDQYAEFVAAVGAKADALRQALRDKRITPKERDEIRLRLEAVVRTGLQLCNRIEVLAG